MKHRLLERIAADDHRPLHRRLPPLRKPLQKPLQKPPRRRQIGVLVSSAVIVVMMLALIWFRGEPATPATALSNDQILGEREIALVQGRVPGDNRLIALLEAPQTVAHDLVPNSPASEARAALYVHIGDPRVGILIRDLPPAPVGHTYQLWVANGAGQVSLGIFTARSDGTTELIALAPAPVDAYTDFMVTVEPHGGAITPSSVIVWQVKL
ncbi:MAG: anti-sigma factor [Roseiflexaceae bacterium]|nr:anti-sigma factor [Roseiflexaceae bacterium]